MRSSEGIAVVYFLVLAAAAMARRIPAAIRVRIVGASVAMAAAAFGISGWAPPPVRDWTPVLFLLAGYYVTGWFFVEPSAGFERWLGDWDRRLLGDPTTRFAAWPRLLLAYLEVVYVGCFVLVPAGFAALAATGRSMLADRYWSIVTLAEFGSFVSLTVASARPPWLVERAAALRDRAIHRAALHFVEDFTIRVNTFPSGHVAGSLAVAFALLGPLPWLGAVFLLLAVSIAVACIVGRYHYVADVVAGVLLALVLYGLLM